MPDCFMVAGLFLWVFKVPGWFFMARGRFFMIPGWLEQILNFVVSVSVGHWNEDKDYFLLNLLYVFDK